MFPFSFISGGAGGLSPEALAWEANIIANGGTIDPAILAIFDEYFFIPAVANGNILTELDRLNIYCGLNGYETAARTNIIKSAHFVTPVSSPIFDNNGYKSGGTSYLDLNYNPATEGIKYLLNNASLGYVVKNPTYSSQRRAIGANDITINRADMSRDSDNTGGFLNSTSAINQSGTFSGNVFNMVIRNDNVNFKLVRNATENSSAIASSVIPNLNQFELCLNYQSVPLGPFDTEYHLCSFAGSGSLDYSNLRIILNNLFTALGV
jgi:hypothetical protein